MRKVHYALAMNPAEQVIKKMGGVPEVAEIVGIHQSNVLRWGYPKGRRNGRGGIIPSKHQSILLTAARARGIDLKPEDFFEQEAVA